MTTEHSTLAKTWRLPTLLFFATLYTTLRAGAEQVGADPNSFDGLWRGAPFALPLLAILTTHEFGHYIAGRIHGTPVSPPHFIPLPFGFGTLGAVIGLKESPRDRNQLFDVGAAGPLAGLAVALPVLIYGILNSEIEALPARSSEATLFLEGHSLLYKALLYACKGAIPHGHDIMLSQTALAGWVGLLVTMINLVPVGQLDGGHIAQAWLGERAQRVGKLTLWLMPVVALATGIYFAVPTYSATHNLEFLQRDALAGINWIVWLAVLHFLGRSAGGAAEHPPIDSTPLSRKRTLLAVFCAVLFVLLFMPSWGRSY